ncbi:MAG: choloylglycine hydrolase family protein [Elusimicrobiaceae bacterium]
MKNKLLVSALLAGLLAAPGADVSACSSIRLTAKDGTVLSARTMEFGYEVGYSLIAVPKETKIVSPDPNGGQGLEWKTSYNYLGVSVFGNDNVLSDGMNEAGLAASGLWFENNTKWPDVKAGENKKALAHAMLITWMLGNCKDVADVKAKLANVKVFGFFVPQMKMVAPMHFEVDDASGASIVIESENGRMHIYDNPIGILTNAPNFPWMVTNLRNYVGMKNTMPDAENYAGISLVPTGHGSGMIGLPGDLTPPSRFVRLGVQIHNADQASDAKGLLNLAMHLDNTVDIVRGMAIDKSAAGAIVSSETTQWTAFKDLTNRVWYYRTYDNSNLRKIDLRTINFADGKSKKAAMYGDAEIITDVTSRLK